MIVSEFIAQKGLVCSFFEFKVPGHGLIVGNIFFQFLYTLVVRHNRTCETLPKRIRASIAAAT